MPVMYQDWINRQDLRDNLSWYYLFGDNMMRYGLGGQAAAMRGEPNAIGIATKNGPSMDEHAMWIEHTEDDAKGFIAFLQADLAKAIEKLDQDYMIVIPSDGLGTGLSKLPDNAPITNAWLNTYLFETLPAKYGEYKPQGKNEPDEKYFVRQMKRFGATVEIENGVIRVINPLTRVRRGNSLNLAEHSAVSHYFKADVDKEVIIEYDESK